MATLIVTTCFTEGCEAELPGEAGVYYCDQCVERQTAAHQEELAAFDAFHDWADNRAGRRPVRVRDRGGLTTEQGLALQRQRRITT